MLLFLSLRALSRRTFHLADALVEGAVSLGQADQVLQHGLEEAVQARLLVLQPHRTPTKSRM